MMKKVVVPLFCQLPAYSVKVLEEKTWISSAFDKLGIRDSRPSAEAWEPDEQCAQTIITKFHNCPHTTLT